MSRSTQAAKTREHLLDVASRLFYRKGIRVVGVDEIVAEAGIAKMTLYKYFPSKEDLILAFLRKRDLDLRASFELKLKAQSGTPTARLLAVFDLLAEWFGSTDFRGCAFINAVSEIADPAHPTRQVALEHKRSVQAALRSLATEAGLREPAVISRSLMLLMEGAIVTALREQSPEAAHEARKAAQVLIAHAERNDPNGDDRVGDRGAHPPHTTH